MRLVEPTLATCFASELPKRLIGDRVYDSDPSDAWLTAYGIELVAPRRHRRKARTQDSRKLRRYKRRWKMERLFAWLGNFRRMVVRYGRHLVNDLGFVHLAGIMVLLRHYL